MVQKFCLKSHKIYRPYLILVIRENISGSKVEISRSMIQSGSLRRREQPIIGQHKVSNANVNKFCQEKISD